MELRNVVDIDASEFFGTIADLGGRIRNLDPAMRLVGNVLLESIDDTFAAEGRPGKWQALSERTLEGKRDGQKILEGDTHRLREGIHIEEVGRDFVDIAPDDLPYARIQHLGGKAGYQHKTVIPARSYLVAQPADSDRIMDIIADYLLP